MPAWVKDHGLWNKAKTAVAPHADSYDEPYAVVAHVYKSMGGGTKGEVAQETMPDAVKGNDLEQAKRDLPDYFKKAEATPQSAVAQLVRGGVKNETAFSEATKIDRAKREIEVIIILEGPGNDHDKNYYTREAIKDGVVKFSGARAFLNHQTDAEMNARPEQDVRELCGFYKDTFETTAMSPKLGKKVAALGAIFVADESEAGEAALAKADAQILYKQIFSDSKECYAGISVNTGGWQDGTIEYEGDEWAKIVAFEGVQSADIVTRPGAGGAFLRLTESMVPVGANNLKESAMKNAEKFQKLVTKLQESDKALKAETDAAKKKALQEAAAQVRKEMKQLLEAEGEDEVVKPKEGEDDEPGAGDGAGDGDDASMDALKKHLPMTDGESEADYTARVKQAFGHAQKAGLMKKDESEEESEEEAEMKMEAARKRGRESAAVSKFRKESPVMYRQLMAELRESLGAERHDFAGIKEANDKLRKQVGSLMMERDLAEAERELNEAGIPTKYLAPADLVRLDEAARKRTIERTKMLMEGAGAAHVWSGSGPSNGDGGGSDLDLGKYQIPIKTKAE